MHETIRLGELLAHASRFKPSLAVFLPMSDEWNEHTHCVVDDLDEIEDPDAGVVIAGDRRYEYALGMDAVQSIVQNALSQCATATPQQILAAFLFYYDHDAFLDLASSV